MSKMRAAQVAKPGAPIEFVEVERPEPAAGQVRVKISASGICHTDAATVYNAFPGITYPVTPGHEIAGTIDAVGEGVSDWSIGERVGVGWYGGNCGHCDSCRRGDNFACRQSKITGMQYNGGYAEYVVAAANALARIPENLNFEDAAPLMCAGLTTYNGLRGCSARPGDLVAIQGIGGLGHLAVQFAVRMGFETVAIARGGDKEAFARKLGAHHYVDSEAQNPAEELAKLGGAKAIVTTVTSAKAMAPMMGGLGMDGQLLILGAASDPMELDTRIMIGKRLTIHAQPAGTSSDAEDTLRFAALMGVRPIIETAPLDHAHRAFERMLEGRARFRMVLVP